MHSYFADGHALVIVTGSVSGVHQHLEIGDEMQADLQDGQASFLEP